MRYVCPQDVKKMLLQHATSVYWKKWAARHEHEELKEEYWAGAGSGIAGEENEGRVDGKASKQTLFDIGWSDKSEYQACHKEKGTEQHRLHHCPEWYVQVPSESGCKKREPQRRSGSGKEVLLRILSVKVNGTRAMSV